MNSVALSVIVAVDRAGVIGRDGQLPWYLPDDLKHFKSITMGKPIIMGRRTHASIGRALPGRRNIVLTRDRAYSAPGCERFGSLPDALATIDEDTEAILIGGAAVYREGLAAATRIYLTRVDAEVDGDTWFPEIDAQQWREIAIEQHAADDRHAYDYRFSVLERIERPI